MKKKHPVLYAYLKRIVIVLLVLIMGFTIFQQVTGRTRIFEMGLSFIITPVQNLVSTVMHEFSAYLYRLKLRGNIEYEYNQLKAQNDELILRTILYEELEEENNQLRALLGEYETRATMNPILARVIASETGNYFSTFTINKGSIDGVDSQMAVITAQGLIGYVYEVYPTTSKVITIIDDQASLAALIESSRDQGAIKGTLGSTGEPLCRMYYLSADSVPRPGDRVITSGVGVSFPKGLLIGYVRESTRAIEDNKHYIVVEPAADFEHVENVLVLRYYAEIEEMPDNYNNTEVILAPVATARPQAVIEEERLNASTPVPLPDAPGAPTASPQLEVLDVMIDEEAMGDSAGRYATPTPEPTEEPIETPTPTPTPPSDLPSESEDPDLYLEEDEPAEFPEDF
ncbi:MAG: rod shape-determining protein MreC [Clostridia bacterium]|nr:rod shape-determining protein MreC [Clostridia bacterium]